jgi:hypothetical protein
MDLSSAIPLRIPSFLVCSTHCYINRIDEGVEASLLQQPKPSYSPPPHSITGMRVGQLICVSLFPTVIPPTEIYVQYPTCFLTMRRSQHSTSKVVIPSDFFNVHTQPNSLDTMPTSDTAATAAAAVAVQEAARSSARCCPRGGPQRRPLLPTQRPATPPAAAHDAAQAAVRNTARCCPHGGPRAGRRPSTQQGRGRVQFLGFVHLTDGYLLPRATLAAAHAATPAATAAARLLPPPQPLPPLLWPQPTLLRFLPPLLRP